MKGPSFPLVQHIVNRYLPKQAQKKGVPSALHEVHAVDSTTSQRIYTFAPSIIQTIFMQYPAVERAYKDYVPDKLTETDFWKKFVHSRTFYREHERDRRRAAPGEEDLFEKYHREMENAESEVKKRRLDVDLSRDLTATVEDHLEVLCIFFVPKLILFVPRPQLKKKRTMETSQTRRCWAVPTTPRRPSSFAMEPSS